MKHIYITEDGTIFVHNEPTPEDLALADNGCLTILRIVPGSLRGEIQEYNPNSKHHVPWDVVETGCLESDGERSYHTPPRYEGDLTK